ncbi:Arabinose efflux permease [Achromobacter xylosoxidans]|nr:hypothetical protein HMPREF0005_03177 [Achromobacter xylosoxidans C54]CUJ27498.1 Arabinose efflux permease [Achromobacter xylosoxidans]CUJ90911.1 Arabinose efflux permease [Achromobacter xylosoxidans]
MLKRARQLLRRLWRKTRARPALRMTLGCLAMLLLAQTLIGVLSLSALNRQIADMTADRLEVAARQVGGRIENGLRLGKPLGQYFGLDRHLHGSVQAPAHLSGAAVHLLDGRELAAEKRAVPGVPQLLRALGAPATDVLPKGMTRRAGGALALRLPGSVTLAKPLRDAAGVTQGAVILSTQRNTEASRTLVKDNLRMLVLVTLVAGLGLAAASWRIFAQPGPVRGRRGRFAAPLLALMIAQGVYAGYTIHTFRGAWLDVTRGNAQDLAEGLQRDLNRVLSYGVETSRLRGVEASFGRLIATFPTIARVELADADGRALARSGAPDAQPPADDPAPADELTITLPLGAASAPPQSRGSLVIQLSQAVIASSVLARALDAATVIAVAMVAAIEMLLLLSLLSGRGSTASAIMQDGRDVGRATRPVMFCFLFAWALPLGFLPLFARSLPADGLSLSPNIMIALPISAEMACGLVAALCAGRLSDLKSWRVPVLIGLALSSAGMLACLAAATLPQFILARGLVGLGYGLTWMGLQGLVVSRSPPDCRGRNMAGVIAGLFAGHLSGAAVGAMLMEQLGPHAAFGAGAGMLILPLAGVLLLLRPYNGRIHPSSTLGASMIATTAREHLRKTASLLGSRDFALLLIASVTPFAMSQVGLLSYALPLYLEAEGVAASSIGRVLMVYGLGVIYLGPLMGQLVDRTSAKKRWIVLGGLIGSAGMLGLYFNSGLIAATIAVLMLALASCCLGASQAPYMLALPQVRGYGTAGALGLMRASDKLGQMAGPLIVGAATSTLGLHGALALLGAIYLVLTVLFHCCARCGAKRRGEQSSPQLHRSHS